MVAFAGSYACAKTAFRDHAHSACADSMASKSVKAHLKAAKTAVGKKEYTEVSRICQEVFAEEEGNYMAHVFAGLAAAELGRPEEARQHYRTAITAQPTDPLAWKGLANYYDKHPPSGQEEVEDALQTYQTLLPHVDNDMVKKRGTLSSLASLHHKTGDTAAMVATYSSLLETYPETYPETDLRTEELTRVWHRITDLLLQQKTLQKPAWDMLVRGVEVVLGGGDEEMALSMRERVLPLLLDRYKLEGEGEVREMLWSHCQSVLETRPQSQPALTATVFLSLEHIISALPEDPGRECVRDWALAVLELLPAEGEGEGGGERQGLSALACVGVACVRVQQGQWRDVCKLLEKGLSLSLAMSEARLLLTWTCVRLHSFTAALRHAQSGIREFDKFPAIAVGQAQWKLRLLEARALLGLGQAQQALSILTELVEKGSCDHHVMVALTRADLALGDVQAAEQVVQSLAETTDPGTATANMLQGEVSMAKKDYDRALSWFESVLGGQEQYWVAECLLLKAMALWLSGNSHASYATLLKAAKADTYNPEVMLYIGHYQRQVAGDVNRALKCYQKAVQLQPDHVEALSCSGDLLFTAGREEEAFGAYSEVTKRVPVTRAKQAWLRLGLYHRKKGEFNDAIHCFQKSLTTDTCDKQCWECLAEAYLARGSHTSALRTFTRVVELDPESVYCLYQLGNINQVRGELSEAVARYSAVLALQPHYLPALKGRGHTHYLLALSCLRKNFDSKAVTHVSLALADLTRAASIKPRFLCVWKLIGSYCTCLSQVLPDIARPAVPDVLLGKGGSLEATSVVDKTELFLTGCRSFARGLQLSPECSSLWHDLALAYYHLTQISSTEEKRAEFIGAAFSVVNKALGVSPRDHTHWNLLGVIAAHPAMGKPAVAQHAFIMSIQLESNNGLAWTNLGALYLKHGDIELAHKAFSIAQSLDPGYAAAWIGQATIAHSIGDADCMDLYRHTTELEFHSEGSHGYGYWVCHSLSSLTSDLILEPGGQQLNQLATRGLLQARDCLQRLVEREPGDVWALNHLALLLEQEGLLAEAERALQRAEELVGTTASALTASQSSAVIVNRARVLSALERHDDSLRLWTAVNPSPTDLSARLHLALALFRAGKYAESLQVYEAAVEVAHGNMKSAVLGACAMVAYAQGDTDNCMTHLFRAFETSPPSLHVLIELCVIGCLTLDLTLLQTALLETSKTIEWKGGDGQWLHGSCLLALKLIVNSSQVGSECVDTATSVLKQLPDVPAYVEAPPLPLAVPLLADSCSNAEALLVPVQKLFHSYPTSVWSVAALTHAVQHNSTKTGLKVLLAYYIENAARGHGKHMERLKSWMNS